MIECTSVPESRPDDATTKIDSLVVENENLRRKILTLPVIEQAKGILMGRYGVPADAAFQMLRQRVEAIRAAGGHGEAARWFEYCR